MKEKLTGIFSKLLTILIVFLSICILSVCFHLIRDGYPSLFGFRFFYVTTESMAPTIEPNSLVFVRNTALDDLKEGDVITFLSTDPTIYGYPNTHRIVGRDTDGSFVTMGDNNPRPDLYTVAPDKIIGKVIGWTKPVTPIATFFRFAVTRQGFFVCVVMPLMIITMMFLSNFIQTLRMDFSDEEVIRKMVESEKKDDREMARQILESLTGKPADRLTQEDIDRLLEQYGGEKDNGVQKKTEE